MTDLPYEPWNMDNVEIDDDYKPVARYQVTSNAIGNRTPKDFTEAINNIRATVPKTVEIPKVKEKGIIFSHTVKGEELNTVTDHIQENLKNLRSTIIKQNKTLENVYSALSYIDKENVFGLKIALDSAERNSEDAKTLGEKNKEIQIGLAKTIEVLDGYHQKLKQYKHLDNIDEIWENDQTTLKRLNIIEKKIKSTTLAGYGIKDAYTKKATENAISKAIKNKVDKNSVFTKQETENKLKVKADKEKTLAGYGIEDAYTKTEADGAINKAIKNKVDKDSVYTKQETENKLKVKADKEKTLAGYGIEDAYTKTETNTSLETKASKSELTAVKQNIERVNSMCKDLLEDNERKQNSLDEMNKKIIRLYFITGIAIAICILQFLFMYQRLA